MNPYIREIVKLSIVKEQIPKLEDAIDLLYIHYCVKPIQFLWKKNSKLIKKRNKKNGNCKICGYKITHIIGFPLLNINEYFNCGCEFYGNKLNLSKEELEAHLQYNVGFGNPIK